MVLLLFLLEGGVHPCAVQAPRVTVTDGLGTGLGWDVTGAQAAFWPLASG